MNKNKKSNIDVLYEVESRATLVKISQAEPVLEKYNKKRSSKFHTLFKKAGR